MRHQILSVVTACIAALAFPAISQTVRASTFSDYDPLGRGKVSLADWMQHDWSDALARYDANHDDRITKTEFVSVFCTRMKADLGHEVPQCPDIIAKFFNTLDHNNDGELSRAESDSWSRNLFRQNDRNHDGFVTASEMQDTASGR